MTIPVELKEFCPRCNEQWMYIGEDCCRACAGVNPNIGMLGPRARAAALVAIRAGGPMTSRQIQRWVLAHTNVRRYAPDPSSMSRVLAGDKRFVATERAPTVWALTKEGEAL